MRKLITFNISQVSVFRIRKKKVSLSIEIHSAILLMNKLMVSATSHNDLQLNIEETAKMNHPNKLSKRAGQFY